MRLSISSLRNVSSKRLPSVAGLKQKLACILNAQHKANDDDFVSKSLKAHICSDMYFEIHINTLMGQVLYLNSDCTISDGRTLRAGNKISNISYRKIPKFSDQNRKIINEVSFITGRDVFRVNETDFIEIIRKCFCTSKTVTVSFLEEK